MKIPLLILLVFFGALAFSQDAAISDTLPEPAAVSSDTNALRPFSGRPGMLPYDPNKRMSVRLEVGSAFGFSSGAGNLFGVYTAPHISYRMSDRWRLNVGMRIQNTNFINYYNPYNPFFPEFTRTFDSNITQTLIYAESEYFVNPRLMISTRVFKEVSVFDQPQVNPRALDLNSEGFSVGFNYQVNDNLQFGAEFGYSRGANPHSPWQSNMFGVPGRNPYGLRPLSPFSPGF